MGYALPSLPKGAKSYFVKLNNFNQTTFVRNANLHVIGEIKAVKNNRIVQN